MHACMNASAGSLVSCTGGKITSKWQHSSQQAVQDDPCTPHVHLAAVVSAWLYMVWYST